MNTGREDRVINLNINNSGICKLTLKGKECFVTTDKSLFTTPTITGLSNAQRLHIEGDSYAICSLYEGKIPVYVNSYIEISGCEDKDLSIIRDYDIHLVYEDGRYVIKTTEYPFLYVTDRISVEKQCNILTSNKNDRFVTTISNIIDITPKTFTILNGLKVNNNENIKNDPGKDRQFTYSIPITLPEVISDVSIEFKITPYADERAYDPIYTVILVGKGQDYIRLSSDLVKCKYTDRTKDIYVYSNIPWVASTSSTWLSLNPSSGKINPSGTKITNTVLEYKGHATRYATVNLISNSKSASYTVEQEGHPYYLTGQGDNFPGSYTAGSIDVDTNCRDINIYANSSWLTVTGMKVNGVLYSGFLLNEYLPLSGDENKHCVIEFTMLVNDTSDSRTTPFWIDSQDYEHEIVLNVTQAAGSAPSSINITNSTGTTLNSIELDYEGNPLNIYVTSNKNWSIWEMS